VATSILSPDAYRVGQPLWWVNRLYNELIARRPFINKWDNYYRGDFPLPWLAPQAAEEFRRILKMSRANYMGLVVDAQCERLAIEGFRLRMKPGGDVGDDEDESIVDDELLRIWEANSMDTQMDQGVLEAAITGVSYVMVAPNPKDSKTPLWYVEHSSQTVIAFEAGTNRRTARAALKVYIDEWTGQVFATLYLPDFIWKFQTDGKEQKVPALPGMALTNDQLTAPVWTLRTASSDVTAERNPIGIVPLFELPNNPRLLTGGQSELYDLTDSQDRIVKTIADRLMTQDYGAFPQKWASGWPEEDAAGNPTAPIEVGRDRMVTTEVVETKFGQFTAADLMGYISAKPEDVKDIASRSRTPAQYLLGEMNNVNGDTLKASESGLVAKVRQRMRGYNPGLIDSATLIRRLAGKKLADGQYLEPIWRNPEFRTEGELVDALLKMSDLGVPEEALWERWGASPLEIERWKAMLEDKMARAAAGDATVVLADRFRQAAAPVAAPGTPGAAPGSGAQQTAARQPSPANGFANRTTTAPVDNGRNDSASSHSGGQSGGVASTSAKKRRPNAPKPATT
jgi:hypothetical protein